jgi:hypothetical protein
MSDERRVADEWMRENLSTRLAAIETAQKLYHDEIKSITEGLHRDIESVKREAMELHYALYGGPKADNVGLLERFRGLLWKAGIATTVSIAFVGFFLKLFSPTLNRVAQRMVGEDPVAQYKDQRSRRKLQRYNRETKQWEYYIQFEPVGQQGQKGQTQ